MKNLLKTPGVLIQLFVKRTIVPEQSGHLTLASSAVTPEVTVASWESLLSQSRVWPRRRAGGGQDGGGGVGGVTTRGQAARDGVCYPSSEEGKGCRPSRGQISVVWLSQSPWSPHWALLLFPLTKVPMRTGCQAALEDGDLSSLAVCAHLVPRPSPCAACTHARTCVNVCI